MAGVTPRRSVGSLGGGGRSTVATVVVLTSVLLMALNMRSGVATLSPIVAFVSEDIGLTAGLFAIIGMLPPACFAASALTTPILVRRLSLERVTLLSVGLQLLGLVLRTTAVHPLMLLAASVVLFWGVGFGNVVLPPLVRKYAPKRIALFTTLYLTLMSVGTFVPTLLAVPVSLAAGWRASLGLWAVLGVLVCVSWLCAFVLIRRQSASTEPAPVTAALSLDEMLRTQPNLEMVRGSLWRSPVALAVTLVFSLSGMNAYVMFTWLPALLRDTAGVSVAQAGNLLALFGLMGLPAALLVPYVATRLGSVSRIIYTAIGFGFVGYGGLLLFPTTATWLWVFCAGLVPLLFPVAMLLVNRRTRSQGAAVALSGFVQWVGYSVSALGPLLVGWLHQVTGTWTAALVFLLALLCVGLWAAHVLRVPRAVEEDWVRAARRVHGGSSGSAVDA